MIRAAEAGHSHKTLVPTMIRTAHTVDNALIVDVSTSLHSETGAIDVRRTVTRGQTDSNECWNVRENERRRSEVRVTVNDGQGWRLKNGNQG